MINTIEPLPGFTTNVCLWLWYLFKGFVIGSDYHWTLCVRILVRINTVSCSIEVCIDLYFEYLQSKIFIQIRRTVKEPSFDFQPLNFKIYSESFFILSYLLIRSRFLFLCCFKKLNHKWKIDWREYKTFHFVSYFETSEVKFSQHLNRKLIENHLKALSF